MMKGFGKIRETLIGVVFLRRISRELKRANDLAEMKLAMEHPTWYKQWKGASKSAVNSLRGPRLSEMSTADVMEWNKQWEERHPRDEEENVYRD